MSAAWRGSIILTVLLGAQVVLPSATASERSQWNAATTSFKLGLWERAEKEFAEFAAKYPHSDRRPEAILRQAQCRFERTSHTGVLELLATNLSAAGSLADQYQFWLAEAQYQRGEFAAAAAAYALLLERFTNSVHRPAAAFSQALAVSRLEDWPGVTFLLTAPTGIFQQLARQSPTNEFVIRGILLLAESRLAQHEHAAAAEALDTLGDRRLDAELDWRRQFLQCRIYLAAGRADAAIAGVSNLLALAEATGNAIWLADSVVFEAGILEQMQRIPETIAALEKNLARSVPPGHRRAALLEIVKLTLAQGRTSDAILRLEKFLDGYPADSAADVALVTLGELRLKEGAAPAASNAIPAGVWETTRSNLLRQALANFDAVATNHPDSTLIGRAQLGRAWCLWIIGQYASSAEAFLEAATSLPFSPEQALALFKAGDCLYRLGNPGAALTNYAAVAAGYDSLPEVTADLLEPALYQTLRASLAVGNLDTATNALIRILALFPESFVCDRSQLLVAQELSRRAQPALAREILTTAAARLPESPLMPELRLAIARTYEQAGDWAAAAAVYTDFIAAYTNHPTIPRAVFNRAWTHYQSGAETNALAEFTLFVAQYPAHELAPAAQFWIGDYFFRRGDFPAAEKNYKAFQNTNWTVTTLTFQAYMMAGRAAVGRANYSDAIDHFTRLTGDTNCPVELWAEAVLAYGDAEIGRGPTETNKPFAPYERAIMIFSKLPERFPTNALVPAALGRIGSCYLQLGGEMAHYVSASNAFRQVIESPFADVAARSQATLGIAIVFEKQAQSAEPAEKARLLKLALDYNLDIFLDKHLREGEEADPFWKKKAGLAAAKLFEDRQQWAEAGAIYQELARLMPELATLLERRIARAQEQSAAPGK